MAFLPRLIPTVIVATSLALTLRVGAILQDTGIAFAQNQTPAKATAPQGGAAPSTRQGPTAPASQPPVSQAPASQTPAAPSPGEGEATGSETAKAKPPAPHFTPAEVEVLQELAKRREALDQRQADQDRRELTLKAVEQRVDEKIAKLKEMQASLDAMIGKSQEQDDERLKSLVHIYENMKPKDAATIFEGMDMPSLLQLLTRMKDLKTAPILAAMAPDKARAVTVAMAQRKELPDSKSN
jgi:flagellar motility protein MotE (MotC chaperone)